MRYLTVVADLDYRGSQRVACNYSIGMQQRGHDARVLTLNALGPRTQELERHKINCQCIALEPKAVDAILSWRPEVVHVHRSGLFEEPFNNLLQHMRQAIDPTILETSIFSRVDYRLPEGVIDVHLHLSDWCLWKWQRWSRALNYRPTATVIPYSILSHLFYRSSPDEIVRCKQELNIPADDFVFLRVGATSEAKWHPMLIDAFAETFETTKAVSLLLVAPPPSICARVATLPKHIQSKVFMIPAVNSDSRLRQLYSCGDVMLHAARIGESFGMVLVESLLCETPIITLSTPTKDNSQTEIVEHRRSGIVANDHRSFVQAMIQCTQNQDLARALGQFGRSQVMEHYDNRAVCQRIETLCDLLFSLRRDQSRNTMPQTLNEAGYVTQIPDNYAFKRIRQFDGHVALSAQFLTDLVHQPQLYRFYATKLLHLKHKIRQ